MSRESRKSLKSTIERLTSENRELQLCNREQARRIDKLEFDLGDLRDKHNIIESGNLRKCDNELCLMCVYCITEKNGHCTTIMGCKKDIACEDFMPLERFKFNK